MVADGSPAACTWSRQSEEVRHPKHRQGRGDLGSSGSAAHQERDILPHGLAPAGGQVLKPSGADRSRS